MSVIGVAAPMDYHEKMRMRAAAYRVRRVYPGAAGEVLALEIQAWEDFGYRLGDNSRISRLIDQVMTAVLVPEPPPPVPPAHGGFVHAVVPR